MKYDVVIIGAGVMGCATAYQLSKQGKKVLLLDQFNVKNDLNSSQDYSRAFRYEYGDEEFYTNMAVKSRSLWLELEKEYGKQIYFQCGSLLLGDKEESYATKSFDTLKKLGHKVDLWKKDELKKKYPQFSAKYGVMDYCGGIIDAYAAVDAFVSLAKKNGVEVKENTKVTDIKDNSVVLENGNTVECDKIVVTCGVWAPKLANVPIKSTKQQLVYFKPKNLDDFKKDKFPVFGYLDEGFYGFPLHGIDAVKVSNHFSGEVVEPEAERKVTDKFIEDCRAFFKRFIPALADAEVVKTKV